MRLRLQKLFVTVACASLALSLTLSYSSVRAQNDSSNSGVYTLPAASAAMIEQACSNQKGPAAQSQCVRSQIADMQAAGPVPDMTGFSPAAAKMIEAGCADKKYSGPAAYARCVQGESGVMRAADPVLATLDTATVASIERACSSARYGIGSQKYASCILNQVNQMQATGPIPDVYVIPSSTLGSTGVSASGTSLVSGGLTCEGYWSPHANRDRDGDGIECEWDDRGATSTSGSYSSGTVRVRGYYRRDGTYVRSHTRRKSRY